MCQPVRTTQFEVKQRENIKHYCFPWLFHFRFIDYCVPKWNVFHVDSFFMRNTQWQGKHLSRHASITCHTFHLSGIVDFGLQGRIWWLYFVRTAMRHEQWFTFVVPLWTKDTNWNSILPKFSAKKLELFYSFWWILWREKEKTMENTAFRDKME